FPLGTVRLMEQIPHSNPPSASELASSRSSVKAFLQLEIQPQLAPAIEREAGSGSKQVQLAGTGGTASILARMELKLNSYDRAFIGRGSVTLERVPWHVEHLWSLPLAARQKASGLPPDRADVILTGVLIYEAIMQEFGFSALRVSTRGLRFAAVAEL